MKNLVRSPLAALFIVPMLTACGGSSPAPTPEPKAASATPPGGPLSASLAKTLPKDAASTAVVAFAVTFAEPRDPDDAAKFAEGVLKAGRATPPKDLAAFASTAGPAPRLHFVGADVGPDLPLDLAGIAASAGPSGPALTGARSLTFVRFSGKAASGDSHLRGAALAAALLAGEGQAVIDLGTRRAWTSADFRAWLNSADWLADQVIVDAQQGDDGQVTFFTRGMARFGQPDLEARAPVAEARGTFDAFQKLLQALRAHGPAKAGDTVGGVKLGKCTRPPEAIERTCVAM